MACGSAGIGAAVSELFRAFDQAPGPAAPDHRFQVLEACDHHGDGACLHRGHGAEASGSAAAVLSTLLTAVNRVAIDGFGGLSVHAGVLASGDSAIAFPAPSGTGKTTLAAACLMAGFDYVSDETLCVGYATGSLHAYPRALALSAWSRRVLGLDAVASVDLGGGEAAIPPGRLGTLAAPTLRLAHIIDLARRPEGSRGPCVLSPVARADAMTWLLRRSFNHYKHPAESFRMAAGLARRARSWRLEYGDPLEAAALLRDRLS